MAPNCTSSYCILHHHVPHILRTEKKPILRKNALDKAMKTTDFLNPDPYAHIFLIFYVMKWEACKKHFCCTKVLKGAYATTFELRDQLSFFHGTSFWLQRIADTQTWLSRPGYLVQYFFKNERSETVTSRKTIDSTSCQLWNFSFQANTRTLENCYSPI